MPPPDAETRISAVLNALRLYELVARRFLAAVSPDALRRAQRVALRDRATGEAFTFSREVLLEPGFLEVLQTRRDDEGARLVEQLPAAGAAVPLRVDAVPRERQTRPPDRLTEAECVALMEKHGIGTDASIPSHIENVCKRNYVQVDSGRRLRPTVLGLALARGFGVVDAALVQPAVRAQTPPLDDWRHFRYCSSLLGDQIGAQDHMDGDEWAQLCAASASEMAVVYSLMARAYCLPA